MSKIGLKAEFPAQGVSVKLSLFTYIDENVHVVYSPALDLFGYGNDEMEARQSFEVSLREYVNYTTEHKTLGKDLKKYGWSVDKSNQQINSPEVSALIESNKTFREMVNSKPFKKFDLSVQLPAFA